MKLTSIKPMLWTIDLQEAIDFYTNVFGFTCREVNEDWSFAYLHRDEIEVILVRPNEQTPFDNPTFTGSIYIQTEQIDELWEELKDKMVVCYPIEDCEWGMR